MYRLNGLRRIDNAIATRRTKFLDFGKESVAHFAEVIESALFQSILATLDPSKRDVGIQIEDDRFVWRKTARRTIPNAP